MGSARLGNEEAGPVDCGLLGKNVGIGEAAQRGQGSCGGIQPMRKHSEVGRRAANHGGGKSRTAAPAPQEADADGGGRLVQERGERERRHSP